MLKLRQIGMRFAGAVDAVVDVDLEVRDGEFMFLLGPSGSGKTTTLRMIAGFTRPTSGTIELGGRAVNDVAPYRRDIGMVFQRYALFPHLTVAQNVAFGLKMRRSPERERPGKVADVLALVRLWGMEDRYPHQLSGGQQQRVALARALAYHPALLLLDEPLANLDRRLRDEMRVELKRIQQELGTTMLFVTHDQEEALTLGDRIGVMHNGRLEQVGTPVEIYRRPASRFVASFIGDMNFLPGAVCGECVHGLTPARLAIGGPVQRLAGDFGRTENIVACVRPEHVKLQAATAATERTGTIRYAGFGGDSMRYIIAFAEGIELQAREPALETRPTFAVGERVAVEWDEPALGAFAQ